MIVVIIYKELHHKDAVSSAVLTVLNINYSVVRFVFELVPVISEEEWTPGRTFCYAAGATQTCFALLRFTFILAITVERFGVVMCPFKYPQRSTKVAAATFAVGSVYSVLTSLAVAVDAFHCDSRNRDNDIFSRSLCTVYNVLQGFMIALSGIVVPLILKVVVPITWFFWKKSW